MPTWNPKQYLKFKAQRLRPAIDLASRIYLEKPSNVIDLGCGTGTSTAILKEKWPRAAINGLDSSHKMLEKAKAENSGISWIEADLNEWEPAEEYDVIFSNATLHWIKNISRLFDVLFDALKSDGVLAFQVPNNESSPYQQCITSLANQVKWRESLKDVVNPIRYSSTEFYYELLARRSSKLDIWETQYYHIMDDQESIIEWVTGTGLRPYLDALNSDPDRDKFKTELLELYRKSYPRASDGKVIFPFNRQFVIAHK